MLVECVTEKLFPQLNIEQSKANAQIGGNSSLQLITLRERRQISDVTVSECGTKLLADVIGTCDAYLNRYSDLHQADTRNAATCYCCLLCLEG